MRAFFQSLKKSFPISALVLCGIASTLLYLRFRTLQVPATPEAAASLMQTFGILVALLFLTFIAAAFAIKRIIRVGAFSTTAGWSVIVGFAVLFRIPLLMQTPWLSNDVYRYVWDARVLESGVNPYRYPPEASELSHLRDEEYYSKMSHKHVRAVYPPLLQGLFWVGLNSAQVLAVNPMHALKGLFILFDLLLIFVLMRVLSQAQIDPHWVLLYAWHPLAVIEVASSGHTDVVGVFFLVMALLFLMRRRSLVGAICLAFAFLVKFVSVLLLPMVFFFTTLREERKYNWRAAFAFGATIVICYLPFLAAGENLLSGLSVYSAKWRFNDALFSLFFTPLQALIPDSLVVQLMIPADWQISPEAIHSRRIDLVLLITKGIMAVVFAYCYFRAWRNAKNEFAVTGMVNWPQLTLAILAAFFLLSPTLQPWYLLWILPLLCIPLGTAHAALRFFKNEFPKGRKNNQNGISGLMLIENFTLSRFKVFLWLLSGTVFLSYWVLYTYWFEGLWQEQTWVKWVEFGLPALIFFLPAKYWGGKAVG